MSRGHKFQYWLVLVHRRSYIRLLGVSTVLMRTPFYVPHVSRLFSTHIWVMPSRSSHGLAGSARSTPNSGHAQAGYKTHDCQFAVLEFRKVLTMLTSSDRITRLARRAQTDVGYRAPTPKVSDVHPPVREVPSPFHQVIHSSRIQFSEFLHGRTSSGSTELFAQGWKRSTHKYYPTALKSTGSTTQCVGMTFPPWRWSPARLNVFTPSDERRVNQM